MSWNEERVEKLKALWKEGLSCSQIAAELGPWCSRNAVIGKIHRLGLAERAKTASAPPRVRKAKPAPKPEPEKHPWRQYETAAPKLPATEEPLKPDSLPPDAALVPLEKLRSSNCCFPVGDPRAPDFAFCGAPATLRSQGSFLTPYCAYHSRICYEPQQDRRRRK